MKKLYLILVTAVLLFALALPAFGAEGAGVGAFLEDFFRSNADTLLSILTLCGSLLIAILYKTGLLPLLSRSLGSIGATVKQAADSADTLSQRMQEEILEMKSALAPTVEALGRLFEEIAAMQEGLGTVTATQEAAAKENERVKAALLGEAEMIYGVLQAAALPQFQKEELAKGYAQLRSRMEATE